MVRLQSARAACLPADCGLIMERVSCEICEQTSFKYKCPRCGMKTCSLHCVKKHKANTGCNGVRDKTAYVSVKDFTDGHLLNDYRFLEDVDRKAYSAITDDATKEYHYSNKYHQLRRWCQSRKIWLQLLPPSFSRHKENTSWICRKEKTIYWRVHWKFPQSDTDCVDRSVSEDSTLCDIIRTHLDPDKGDPIHRQRLKKYCHQGIDNLHFFVKVEGRPANSVRYHTLNPDHSLQQNLKYKSVIEFPTIIVVLKESAGEYETGMHDQGNSRPSNMETLESGATVQHLHN